MKNEEQQRLQKIEELFFQCEKDVEQLQTIKAQLQQIVKNHNDLDRYYADDYMRDRENEDSFDRDYAMLSEDGIWNILIDIEDSKKELLKYLANELK